MLIIESCCLKVIYSCNFRNKTTNFYLFLSSVWKSDRDNQRVDCLIMFTLSPPVNEYLIYKVGKRNIGERVPVCFGPAFPQLPSQSEV